MSKIHPDTNSSDENGLDKNSQLFAEYFCCIFITINNLVNNYEISYIKTFFQALKKYIFFFKKSNNIEPPLLIISLNSCLWIL